MKYIITLLISLIIHAGPVNLTEVEAALIFRIAPFVEQGSYDNTRFCIIEGAEHDIYQVLKSNVDNKMLGNKKVNVLETSAFRIKENKCSILILPHKISLEKERNEINANVGHITISLNYENLDISHFVLKHVSNKIKFDANLKKIKSDELKISSKLLRLADRTY